MHRMLRQLEDLFAYRGHAHIVLTMQGAEPLRFSELAQRMYERSTVRVSDSTIARALLRLEGDGLVVSCTDDPRHPTYVLTPHGVNRAAVISTLVQVAQNHVELTKELAGAD